MDFIWELIWSNCFWVACCCFLISDSVVADAVIENPITPASTSAAIFLTVYLNFFIQMLSVFLWFSLLIDILIIAGFQPYFKQ